MAAYAGAAAGATTLAAVEARAEHPRPAQQRAARLLFGAQRLVGDGGVEGRGQRRIRTAVVMVMVVILVNPVCVRVPVPHGCVSSVARHPW